MQTPEDITREFRDLLHAAQDLLSRKYDMKRLLAGDWKQFDREVSKAHKYLRDEVDGPKEPR